MSVREYKNNLPILRHLNLPYLLPEIFCLKAPAAHSLCGQLFQQWLRDSLYLTNTAFPMVGLAYPYSPRPPFLRLPCTLEKVLPTLTTV